MVSPPYCNLSFSFSSFANFSLDDFRDDSKLNNWDLNVVISWRFQRIADQGRGGYTLFRLVNAFSAFSARSASLFS